MGTADRASPHSVSFAPSAGPPSRHDPGDYDAVTHRSHSPDDMHRAPSNKGTNNKLRKPVPVAKVSEVPDTSHANVAPQTGHHDRPDASIPMDDMSNVAHEQPAGHGNQSDIAGSGNGRPPTTADDGSSQKNKPKRDQPAQGTHAPVVLSTPPHLGSGQPVEHQTMANIPVAEEPRTGTTGTNDDTQGNGVAGRPNVLKKKPAQPPSNVTHAMPTQAPSGHIGDGEDHSKVNIQISNDDHGGQDPLHDTEPGHTANANVNGRPQPPSMRKGHPAVSHSDPSRPDTLHLPTQDGAQDNRMGDSAGPSAKKSQDKHSKSPEDVLTENERLAGKSRGFVMTSIPDQSQTAQSKAKAAQAEVERLERETVQRRKEEKEKLAAHRHQEHLDALADLKKVISDHHGKDDKWKTSYVDSAKDKEKRRSEKTTKEKHWQSAFDKLLAEVETDKKWREAESKKPGADAVIDFLKKSNEDQTAFLRALAADIMAQNADQHKTTKEAAKSMAREQVAFNVAGYLDDFSKTLSVSTLRSEIARLMLTR
jgi:hypothetical protein